MNDPGVGGTTSAALGEFFAVLSKLGIRYVGLAAEWIAAGFCIGVGLMIAEKVFGIGR